ncbi:MAG: glycoside hydrolase family 3 C-terminal domain-containing protein [Sandaracinus sp.]|nr:glycoside hydrolase family 3 C-terminal domain-containing protein [Myxococcales bacterium]MCB9611775.1 glycoside hydrolase family 3 C-terminal domain-containing protein [Sandaracinus sp.]
MRVWVWCVLVLFACGDDDGGATDAALGADGALDASEPSDARTYVPEPFEPTAATRAYCGREDADAIEARITELLAQMTPREKIASLHGASVALQEGTWRVAGVERLGVPGFRMLDGPRGLSRMTDKNGTAFPVAMLRGATFDPALERRVGAAMARELKSVGADVLLAPTVNVLRHPRWGRAQETYSEDPHHMGEMALAFVEGVQSEGVLASVKHFAANSIEDTRHEVDVQLDERTLREVYLPAFRRVVVDGRVASVMSAYNRVRGLYCDQQDHLLRTILKGEWEFAGFVESDWILGTHGDVESLRAGLDVEMPAPANFRRLGAALTAGELDERELDASVRRVLRAQLCFGLDARERPRDDASARETPEHLALAREVAERGVVLLRNEGALPIVRAEGTRVAVLGRVLDRENVGDTGSSDVRATEIVTALEGLRELAGEVAIDVVTTLDAEGEATVRAADAVIVFTGLTSDDEGEASIGAGDRETIGLAADEVGRIRQVAAWNERTTVVLEGGAAIVVRDFVDEIEGLLFAFYPGAEGGRALARVLFGDASPSGRLPFSIPRAEADLPAFDNVSTTVEYGYFHGYRHLANEGIAAEFPFGFGLGYGEVTWDAPSLSASEVSSDATVEVRAPLRNAGAVALREVVQVYVTGPDVARGASLRGFVSVEVPAGGEATAVVSLDVSRFAVWEGDAWGVPPGRYELRVGRHAADEVGVLELTVR